MPKQYVYILSDHDEYGAENVVATLIRDDLVELHRASFAFRGEYLVDETRELEELLTRSDADLVGMHRGSQSRCCGSGCDDARDDRRGRQMGL